MRNTIITIILLLTLHQTSKCQPSGYMGKRLSIGYNAQIGMCVFNPSKENTKLMDINLRRFEIMNLFSMTHKHKFNLQYIITFNKSIGIEVNNWKSYYFLAPGNGTNYFKDEFDMWAPTYTIDGGIHWMNSTSFAFKFRTFNEPFAPAGLYFETGLFYIRSVSDLNQLGIPSIYLPPLKERILKTNQFAMSFSVGKQHTLTRHILFNRSIDFGLTLPFYQPKVDPEYVTTTRLFTEDIKKLMNNRIFGSMFINATFGFSLML